MKPPTLPRQRNGGATAPSDRHAGANHPANADPNAHRPGYKPTKVGWIPEEWECVLIDSVATRASGHTPDKDTPNYWNGDVKWVSLADSSKLDRRYITATSKTISADGITNSSARMLPKGSVILLRDASVGRTAILGDEMAVSQHFVVWICSKHLHPLYLFYWLLLQRRQFDRMAFGTTIVTIGMPFFVKLEVPLPPLPEQKKIAAILSTWDDAIEQTSGLISAKKQQKKALMQQLLTGKRRLKGFAGEWTWPRAEAVFERVSRRSNGDEPILSVTQNEGIVARSDIGKRIIFDEANTENYKIVQPNDFVISLRSFQGGLEMSTLCGRVSPAYHVLRATLPVDFDFYRYYFKSYDFINHLDIAVIGIRDGKQVSYDDFAFLRMPFPGITEQRAIAAVLDTADREIDALEAKHKTLQQQKKGLMQKLLTGEVRVRT